MISTIFTMRKNACLILSACIVAVGIFGLPAAEEQDLLAVLQSNAPVPQKWSACQRLRLAGSPKAVPVLAAMLTDERLSQAARHALEGMPFPEAGAALRDALAKTSGPLKAGVIDSLGWRGEAAAVPLLAPLLSDADSGIAAAAATALGRIGGPEAIAALTAARSKAPAAVLPSVLDGLLQCADRLLSNDKPAAAKVYAGLQDAALPPHIRAAAWRGMCLAEPARRGDMVIKALTGSDRPIQSAALKLLHESGDAQLVKACAGRWDLLPAEAQLAVLDAYVKIGAEAMPTVQAALSGKHPAVRVAALRALGELGGASAVPILARAAASSDTAGRDAARESLVRLRGADVTGAIQAHLKMAEPLEKAELLRVLGERGEGQSAGLLLENAASESEPVRLAALASLTRLALPETVVPLLELAIKAKSGKERDPVLRAVYAVCQASPDKNKAAHNVIEALNRLPPVERIPLLPLLAELATDETLAAAQAASRDKNLELARESVRVLGQWPNAAPFAHLLELARSGPDRAFQTLALRGAIEVAAHEQDASRRLACLQEAMAVAQRPEEKKQALGQLSRTPTAGALAFVLKHLNDSALSGEAALAAVGIAEKLAPANPQLADAAAAEVLKIVKDGDVAKRALALRIKPSSAESFIRDWQVCGPYRQEGVAGAEAIFNIAFGPEKPGEKVEWRPVPRGEHVNLGAIFPGQDNCVAYLRTRILAPQTCEAVLLMGSDDGIKAWLNGEVVHSHNVDRGMVADQDTAPIKLKQGANELILKISQGGGGWSACARIVGVDGRPIKGLRTEPPSGPSQPLDSQLKK